MKSDRINLLLIAPEFNYSSGVTRHLLILFSLLLKDDLIKLHFITNGGDAIDSLKGYAGLNYEIFPFINSRFSLKKHYRFYKFLIDYCIKNKIDIVHTHHRYPELVSYFVSRKILFKTITTAHSFVSGFKLFSFKSDKVIAVSNSVKSFLLENFHINTAKIELVYNCIDEISYDKPSYNPLNVKKELGINADDFVFLFAGRIGKIKGSDLLISAFEEFSSKFKQSKLLLIGNIEDRLLLRNAKNNILILPPQKSIEKYYAASDVFILPSRIEPLGYLMLEAGIFCKPFIGSNTGGITDIINDGENGLLFKMDNKEQLISKMCFIYENPDAARIMANKLSDTVKEKCDCKEYKQKMINIYNSLLLK